MAAGEKRTNLTNYKTELEQEERQRRRRAACRRIGIQPGQWSSAEMRQLINDSGVFYINDRMKYLYCMVPKVASTTWTRVLLIATGRFPGVPNELVQYRVRQHRLAGHILRPLARFSDEKIKQMLQQYFKFVFVRHPFDRLVSAFRDRLTSDHTVVRRRLTDRMRRKRKKLNSFNQSGLGKSIGFREFVRYVGDSVTRQSDLNFHWRPQYELCLPCHIDYDFIGHYETLSPDASTVLRKLKARPRATWPSRDPDNLHEYNTTSRRQTLLSALSADDKHQLRWCVYRNDFDVFGFPWTNAKRSARYNCTVTKSKRP